MGSSENVQRETKSLRIKSNFQLKQESNQGTKVKLYFTTTTTNTATKKNNNNNNTITTTLPQQQQF